MRKIVLKFSNITSKNAIHEYLKEKLELPEYCGNSLDALYDCLTDLGSEPEIVFVNTAILEENLGEYGQKILSCFRDAADEYEFTFREKR